MDIQPLDRFIEHILLQRYQLLKDRNVYIFGAGHGGQLVLEALIKMGIDVKAIFDNDKEKWGLQHGNVLVVSPDQIRDLDASKCYIIVSLNAYDEVVLQMRNMGFHQYVSVLEEYSYHTNNQYLTLEKKIDQLHDLFSTYIYHSEFGISRTLQLTALNETSMYVASKMRFAKAVATRTEMFEVALSMVDISGLHLEFGVYQGESINQIASIKPNQTIYGFDSFEGLPEDWRPGFEKGSFAVDKLPDVRQNVVLVKGLFNESLPRFKESVSDNCAFLHIDCDLYSSTKTVFELLAPRIVPGTVIVFDEYYNYHNWQDGEYKAFQEFVAIYQLRYEYIAYASHNMQVAVKIIE